MEQITLNSLISFAISAILIENIVLARFMGCTPFLAFSKNSENVWGMGASVTIVMGVASVITYCLYYYVLMPLDLLYLRTILFILVIALLVHLIEMILKKKFPSFYKRVRIQLPLITTNCAIFGICLINIQKNYSLLLSFLNSVFSGVGFTLVVWLFSLVHERIEENAEIPKPFKGYPIALIAAGLLTFGFMGFTGMRF